MKGALKQFIVRLANKIKKIFIAKKKHLTGEALDQEREEFLNNIKLH